MADRVTFRKAGWTADYVSPTTGKRRQVVVESEDAGWALIQQEGQAAAAAEDKARRTGVKQAPAAPMGGFRCSRPGSCPGSAGSRARPKPALPATATPASLDSSAANPALLHQQHLVQPVAGVDAGRGAEAQQHQPCGLSTAGHAC